MGFALQRGEPAADGVRRMLDELLGDAIDALGRGEDTAVAIHGARKATKRVRAVARVVRPALGNRSYDKLNLAARDAARLLAGDRDRRVVVATFDGLVATAADAAVYDDVRLALPTGREPAGADTIAAALQALEALRGRAHRLRLPAGGWEVLGDGVQAIYRQGARAMSTAAGKTTPQHLHDWRKQVKYLWHATELLTPAWPPVLGPFGDELHALSDALGDDHDLDVLATAVARCDVVVAPGWQELMDGRRARLRAAAFTRGLRVYAERPGAFTRRLRAYYEAWLAG